MVSQDQYGEYTLTWPRQGARHELQHLCFSSVQGSPLDWSTASIDTITGTERDLGRISNMNCYYRVRGCSGQCGDWSIPAAIENLLLAVENLRSSVSESIDGSYEIHWEPASNAEYMK